MIRAKYFSSAGGEFVLDDTIRAMVAFEERNLAADDPEFWRPDRFDVVLCRNVMMYFTPEATRALIGRIAASLAPDGYLFLGHAETLRGISQQFHLRHLDDAFCYQLRGDHHSAGAITATAHDEPERLPALTATGRNDSWYDIIRRSSERILSVTDSRPRAPALTVAHSRAWDRTLTFDLLRAEKFDEAIEQLRAISAETQADPDTQLLLAALLTNSGQIVEAENLCRRLLESDDLNAGAHYLMALCREHAGDVAAAVEHDRIAAYLDADFAMPHLHLGMAAKRAADLKTAIREFEHAAALLAREDAARILLFGGGFAREALLEFCRVELITCHP
jgi:chemotaxis protein methyltransferase CheR